MSEEDKTISYETRVEKFRVLQDRAYQSDFDRLIHEAEGITE